MFTWISKHWLGGLGAIALLGGCVQPDLVSRAPDRLTVTSSDIVVAGPSGYCIDRRSSQARADEAFVLFVNCAPPGRDALLTALVGQAGQTTDGDMGGMRSFFASPMGRASLAYDGSAQSVQVMQMFTRDDAFFLQIRDQSANRPKGLGEITWRTIFDVGGRSVSASVTGLSDRPISDDAALAVTRDFLSAIRHSNGL